MRSGTCASASARYNSPAERERTGCASPRRQNPYAGNSLPDRRGVGSRTPLACLAGRSERMSARGTWGRSNTPSALIRRVFRRKQRKPPCGRQNRPLSVSGLSDRTTRLSTPGRAPCAFGSSSEDAPFLRIRPRPSPPRPQASTRGRAALQRARRLTASQAGCAART